MHIRRITLSGFGSYLQTTTLSLGEGHSVIVGHNGAGKSTIPLALRFLLTDEFATMRPDQRASLLHVRLFPHTRPAVSIRLSPHRYKWRADAD